MKLEKKDGPLGKSDPFFEVIAQPPGFKKPITLHRSEVVMKNLDPVWKRPFVLNVSDVHGLDTEFEVRVYDWDKDGGHDLIGSTRVTLRDWTFGSYQMALKNPDKAYIPGYQSSGAFSLDWVSPVSQEQRKPTPPGYRIQCSGMKLSRMDIGGMKKSDPFFVVKATLASSGNLITLYRSEVIRTSDEPHWRPFQLNIDDVHGLDTEFTVECYDWDADGGHDLIGKAITTLREWTFPGTSLALIHPTKSTIIPGYQSSGAFIVDWVQPLDIREEKQVAVAYRIKPAAMKLNNPGISLLNSKPDPFFNIRCQPPGFNREITLYRSKVIKQNANPTEWEEFDISLEDVRGLDTPFTVNVYDWNKDGDHSLIGSLSTTFREWTFSNSGSYQQALLHPNKENIPGYQSSGAFSIEQVTPLSSLEKKSYPPAYTIQTSAMKLARMDLLSKSDPFFKITAIPSDMNYPITLYRSEVSKDKDSPSWKPFTLNVHDVRGLDTAFVVSVYDWDEDGAHALIGETTTTLRYLNMMNLSVHYSCI